MSWLWSRQLAEAIDALLTGLAVGAAIIGVVVAVALIHELWRDRQAVDGARDRLPRGDAPGGTSLRR
jgi:hypothetical protein